MGNELIGSGCFLVSYDFTNGKDNSVMLVGVQSGKGKLDVINGFKGKEAEELYLKLKQPSKTWEGGE